MDEDSTSALSEVRRSIELRGAQAREKERLKTSSRTSSESPKVSKQKRAASELLASRESFDAGETADESDSSSAKSDDSDTEKEPPQIANSSGAATKPKRRKKKTPKKAVATDSTKPKPSKPASKK